MDSLESSIEKTIGEIFQQDVAPTHNAKIIKEWRENCEINT